MSERGSDRTASRRWLLRLGGLAALLSLGPRPRRASAADGDEILLGQATAATSMTTLVDDSISPYAFVVQQFRGDTAIQAIGGPSNSALQAGSGLKGLGGGNGPARSAGIGMFAGGGGRDIDPASGGSGAVARGGESTSGTGGSGAVAEGGLTSRGLGGDGLVARGHVVPGERATPAAALLANGGAPAVASQAGGIGILAEGGGQPGSQASGLYGYTSSAREAGVEGVNLGTGPGVSGATVRVAAGVPPVLGDGVGVRGVSSGGPGGQLESDSGTAAGGASQTGPGIEASSTVGPGLSGVSHGGYGVVGTSTDATGAYGVSAAGTGAYFETQTLGQWAAHLNNTQAAGGQAGNGALGLYVNGSYIVENGTKSAAVKTDQDVRLLYCMEAAISMFEDFGRARLVNGKARVDIDPQFAETIDTSAYWVFVTPRSADAKPLAVVARDARGFIVQEAAGGTGGYELDYRVVAQRKGLTPAHRLAMVGPS